MPKTFDNMSQRAVYYFIQTMPSFNSVKSKLATAKEQENAYSFIKEIYEKLYNAPEILGMKIRPDECVAEHHLARNNKPMQTAMRSYVKNINILVETLFNIVYLGKADGDSVTLAKDVCQIKTTMPKKFIALGVTTEKGDQHYYFTFPKGMMNGLKLLANISADHSHHKSATTIHKQETRPFLLFSRGVFNPELPWTAEVFHNIYENKEAFDKMNDYFVKNGFIRVDNKEYKAGLSGDVISLDYVKFYGEPEGRIKGNWQQDNYSGIQFQYNIFLKSFATIGVHLPHSRELLESAEKKCCNPSQTVISFLSRHSNCEGCGFCVQMNKTKPLKYIKIAEKNVCSLFVGETWNDFGVGTWFPDEVIEVMDYIDFLYKDKRVEI